MPEELRQILFSAAEVVAAIQAYHRRRGSPAPLGRVVESGAVETPEGAPASFRYVTETGATRQEHLVQGTDLAAALIAFCIDRRVPLPAHGSKSLRQVRGRIALIIALGGGLDSAAG